MKNEWFSAESFCIKREVTKLQYLLLMIALLLEVGREERTKLRSIYWASSFIGDQGERHAIHFANNALFANGLDDNIINYW